MTRTTDGSPCLQERIVDGLFTHVKLRKYPEYGSMPRHFAPPAVECGSCVCGRPWVDAKEELSCVEGKSVVYSLTWFAEVDVYHRVCKCKRTLHYNFSQDGILNLNNLDLFSHELLQWYAQAN